MKQSDSTTWPSIEAAYTDEFGDIDAEVYAVAGEIWPQARKREAKEERRQGVALQEGRAQGADSGCGLWGGGLWGGELRRRADRDGLSDFAVASGKRGVLECGGLPPLVPFEEAEAKEERRQGVALLEGRAQGAASGCGLWGGGLWGGELRRRADRDGLSDFAVASGKRGVLECGGLPPLLPFEEAEAKEERRQGVALQEGRAQGADSGCGLRARRARGLRPSAAAEATRLVRIEMMKNPRWRSPYFWAGFTLQGEWR